MNLNLYWEKLNSSEVFKRFVKDNPEAYLCSGFFTIDKEGTDNQRHFDFYIPVKKQMFSFKLAREIKKVPIELSIEKIPSKLKESFDIKFEEVEKMISDEMEKQGIKNKLQKIIISLQNIDGKNLLVCTVFVSMLGLLKVYIDVAKKKITLFEKKSFFDIMRRVK